MSLFSPVPVMCTQMPSSSGWSSAVRDSQFSIQVNSLSTQHFQYRIPDAGQSYVHSRALRAALISMLLTAFGFGDPTCPVRILGSTIPFRENVSGTRPVRSPPTYGTVWIAWQYRERCGRSGMHRTSLLSWRLRVYSVWLFPRPSSPQIRRSSWTSGIAMRADHHETAR